MQADKLFINGNIYTMKSEDDQIEAIAVSGDKIVFTGTKEQAKSIQAKEVIDLGGKTVIPGLIDTHLHFLAYCQAREAVDLSGADSIEEVIERLREKAAVTPPGEWVRGARFDQTKFKENRFPNRWDLDKVSVEHPIFISRYCLHAFAANSLALKKAGVEKGYKAPVEGTIEFDPNGEPTGLIRENASELFYRIMPVPLEKFADKKRAVGEALMDAASQGLTTIHTYAAKIWKYDEFIGVYQELEEEGRLPVRVIACFDELPPFGMKSGFGNNKIKYGTYKVFSDGSLGSRSAALSEPYHDCPGYQGVLNYTQEELNELVRVPYEMGLQVAIHAIGDRGLDMVLTAIEKAYFNNPRPNTRFRIIHVQVVREDQLERMKKLPLVLDVQPIFLVADLHWAEDRLGKERAKLSFAWKSLMRTGLVVTGSSDCPVEPYNPFFGIFAAVTRQDFNGFPEGGWNPQEKLTVYEAIAMFTKNAAYSSYEEDIKGTLEKGKLADFVVIDKNPFAIDPFELQHIKVLQTFVGGDLVYERGV
jgi:hypothetical protein